MKPKEGRARPAGAGDGARDFRKAAISMVRVFIAFGQNCDFVQLSPPLADEVGSRLGTEKGIILVGGRGETGQIKKAFFNRRLNSAATNFLQTIGEDRNQDFTPQRGVWQFAEKSMPESLEGLALHPWQGRKLLIQRDLLGGSSAQTAAAFSSSPFPLFPGKESSEQWALEKIRAYLQSWPETRFDAPGCERMLEYLR
jgi:hypothetical protein